MTTIVTRAGKGSPLTNNEVDSNFTNLNDAKIETLTSTDSSVTITGTGSSRDLSVPINPDVVSGPASSTDNAVARFDTTTGKLIQNSVVTIDDAGNIENAIIDSFTNTVGADHVHYKIKANETIAKGNILKYVGWNAGDNAIEVVKVSSATDVAIGMAHEALATGEFGLAVVVGTTEGFDTSAFTAGTILYPNTSGGLTSTKPTSGTYQACAFVIRSQSVNGAYLVNFSNPVYVEKSTNTANTAVLRDGSGNFSAGTITASLSGNATTATALATGRTIAITGDLAYTSPSFNGSGNVTAAGTLATVNANVGSFTNASLTVNAKGLVTAVSSGTAPVTSVSGTAPIVSSGGATPAISITQATTSTNGYLSSTDWNTFNGKQAALVSGTNIKTVNGTTLLGSGNLAVGTVTSVAATAGTGISVSGSPITTSGTLTITNTAPDQIVAISSGTGVSITGTYPSFTAAIGQAVATGSNVQFNSLGVGTGGSGTAGEIRATNNITAYYSDERLKTKIGNIENALDKVKQIETMVYHANETAVGLGYDASVIEVGVTAQSVQRVMPQTVAPAPIDDKYLTVRYERLVPLLIEAIKELSAEVKELKAKVE